MIALLNTSILTSYGRFSYSPLTLKEVKELMSKRTTIQSYIGHEATAKLLSTLLQIEVETNRDMYCQEPNDIAIVFKLNNRIEEGKILSIEDINKIGYSFGLIMKDYE